jgi:hypothetical protein
MHKSVFSPYMHFLYIVGLYTFLYIVEYAVVKFFSVSLDFNHEKGVKTDYS